jgi:hypothetical protein
MLDGEVAQALGLGDFLVKYNDPNISGIYTRNPLKLLSSCLKTCTNHFERYELRVDHAYPATDLDSATSMICPSRSRKP